MTATTVLVIMIVSLLAVVGRFAYKIQEHKKTQGQLDQRLTTLEDRFYNPSNYSDAFFRPIAKKKENGKES